MPSRPDFWYGHALVLDRQPEPADHARWVARHAEHFRGTNVQKHTIVWSVEGERDRAPVIGPGVGDAILERSIVFARRSPFGSAPDARVRELRDARDWDAAANLSAASDADASVALQVFGRWRFATIRADGMAGRMRMWGAWEGGDLVAFAGLYASDLVARFVTRSRAPTGGGRGLFRALCEAASDAAMDGVSGDAGRDRCERGRCRGYDLPAPRLLSDRRAVRLTRRTVILRRR